MKRVTRVNKEAMEYRVPRGREEGMEPSEKEAKRVQGVLEESEGEEEVKDFQEVKEILVNLVLLVQLVHLVKMDLKVLGDQLGIPVYLDCLERMVSEDSLEKEAHPVKMDHRALQDNLES